MYLLKNVSCKSYNSKINYSNCLRKYKTLFAFEFNKLTRLKILVLSAKYELLEWTANSTLCRIGNIVKFPAGNNEYK